MLLVTCFTRIYGEAYIVFSNIKNILNSGQEEVLLTWANWDSTERSQTRQPLWELPQSPLFQVPDNFFFSSYSVCSGWNTNVFWHLTSSCKKPQVPQTLVKNLTWSNLRLAALWHLWCRRCSSGTCGEVEFSCHWSLHDTGCTQEVLLIFPAKSSYLFS